MLLGTTLILRRVVEPHREIREKSLDEKGRNMAVNKFKNKWQRKLKLRPRLKFK